MVVLTNGVCQKTLKKHKMIYKTFYLEQNPSMEYQYQNGLWVKRKRGTKEVFYAVDSKGQSVLNNKYKPKGRLHPFWNYSMTTKVVVGLGVVVGSFYLYRRFKSIQTPIL
jgi:hypothetical protein